MKRVSPWPSSWKGRLGALGKVHRGQSRLWPGYEQAALEKGPPVLMLAAWTYPSFWTEIAKLPQLTWPTTGDDAQSGSKSQFTCTGWICQRTFPLVQSSFSMLQVKSGVGMAPVQSGLLAWQLLPVTTTTLPLGVMAGELQTPPPAGGLLEE